MWQRCSVNHTGKSFFSRNIHSEADEGIEDDTGAAHSNQKGQGWRGGPRGSEGWLGTENPAKTKMTPEEESWGCVQLLIKTRHKVMS